MTEIKTQIKIDASPGKVWGILTDFENYPKWNPFIKSILGMKKEGGQLTVKIHPPEGSSMTFKPVILIYKENSELRWLGKLLFKGLFDGEHYFILDKNKDGGTTFIHGEKFTGALVNLFKGTLAKAKDGFEQMNKALKKECEKD